MKLAVVVIVFIALARASIAQSTAFTYQGELKRESALANGLHDLRFRLFDAELAGAQVGGTICVDDVPVIEGRFSVTIDFGQQFATGAGRYLEIDVRTNTGAPCSDVFGYVTLSPRQAITSTPRATHANTSNLSSAANGLSAPDGSPANAVVVDNSGHVGISTGNFGIGTTSPGVPLHVVRDIDPVIVVQDSGPNSTQAGYLGFWNSSNTETGWMGFGSPGSTQLSLVNARSAGDIAILPGPGGRVRVGTHFAAAGDENLRIVRGRVNTNQPLGCAATPTIGAGTGFTVTRQDCGEYTITFSTPFASAPVVTATGILSNGCAPVVTTGVPTSGSVSIQVSCGSSGAGETGGALWSFSFIAIGPR